MKVNDRAVRDLEAALSTDGAISPHGVIHSLNVWIGLAGEITEYTAMPEDYINDLSSRDLLQDVCDRLGRATPRSLVAPMRGADARFSRATVADTDRQLARFYNVDAHRGWWWHRVPATGALAVELAQSS
jgi:hypothetical protein